MKRSLGTQLRHLVELLDGAVVAAYAEQGLAYRPRYTPVMRALLAQAPAPATLGQLAASAGITQPAATQTVALMVKEGLVAVQAGSVDARQKLVTLTDAGRALVPALEQCWAATAAAAASLEAELDHPLSVTIEQAIDALAATSFGARIRAARASLDRAHDTR
jgi:DNA-binding MarR family transcriptional regulator